MGAHCPQQVGSTRLPHPPSAPLWLLLPSAQELTLAHSLWLPSVVLSCGLQDRQLWNNAAASLLRRGVVCVTVGGGICGLHLSGGIPSPFSNPLPDLPGGGVKESPRRGYVRSSVCVAWWEGGIFGLRSFGETLSCFVSPKDC